MNYWLMKSEPKTYSINDLERDQVTCWDGIRNYQARNFMTKEMKIGDKVFFYHSNCEVIGIYGLMKVISESYPDHTAFDKQSKYYDAKSTKENPRWYMVDLKFIKKFKKPITLSNLKDYKQSTLIGCKVLANGNRLSIVPITKIEWNFIQTIN